MSHYCFLSKVFLIALPVSICLCGCVFYLQCDLVPELCFKVSGLQRCMNTDPGFHCLPCPPHYKGNQPFGMGVEVARNNKQVRKTLAPFYHGGKRTFTEGHCTCVRIFNFHTYEWVICLRPSSKRRKSKPHIFTNNVIFSLTPNYYSSTN